MVRKYKRTTDKGAWTKELMIEACAQVANGRSVKGVAKALAIPRTSLRNQLKKGTPDGPNMGRKTVFISVQEEELKNHILLLSKLYFGVTIHQIRQIAFEYAEKNNIKHKFNKITKLAGEGWLSGFLKRCGDVSIRKPEHTSLSRILGFNKADVAKFYSNLEDVYEKYGFTASRIFNCDETGVNTVGNAVKVLAKKGQKQVGLVSSAERGTNTTVVCCFSAAGMYVPPMFIFKRQRMTPLLERDGLPSAIYACSKSGWITEELFVRWLEHFQKTAKCSPEEPVLLVLDNHTSHISLAAYDFCKSNGIVMVSLPPHTSHRTQPLDVVFFGPLKQAINREIDLHLKNKQYERITQYDVAAIFKSAYSRVSSVDKAIKGFQCTGIFPLNPNVFDETEFADFVESSQADISDLQNTNNEAGPSDRGHQAQVVDENKDDLATPSILKECHVNLSEIFPIPKRNIKNTKQRRKGCSQVLTSTPVKDDLIEKQLKREKRTQAEQKRIKAKVPKITKVKKRLVVSSSSSDTSTEMQLDDEGLEDKDSSEEDVCLVCNEYGKGAETWFRCTMCGRWAHKACSGVNKAKCYVCDFCQ